MVQVLGRPCNQCASGPKHSRMARQRPHQGERLNECDQIVPVLATRPNGAARLRPVHNIADPQLERADIQAVGDPNIISPWIKCDIPKESRALFIPDCLMPCPRCQRSQNSLFEALEIVYVISNSLYSHMRALYDERVEHHRVPTNLGCNVLVGWSDWDLPAKCSPLHITLRVRKVNLQFEVSPCNAMHFKHPIRPTPIFCPSANGASASTTSRHMPPCASA